MSDLRIVFHQRLHSTQRENKVGPSYLRRLLAPIRRPGGELLINRFLYVNSVCRRIFEVLFDTRWTSINELTAWNSIFLK